MLTKLYISNLALIQELEVEFSSGLNIITGETGAGKSIIMKALTYLLGGRFAREMIRSGTDRTVIEGVFRTETGSAVIRRVFSANGKSRSFINDEPVSVEKIRSLVSGTIDLHGQFEHQRLLDSATHLEYLDAFGDYQPDLERLERIYLNLKALTETQEKLVRQQEDMREKEELFRFQLQELNQYHFQPDDDIALHEDYTRLSNATAILEGIYQTIGLLDQKEVSVKALLSQADRTLNGLLKYDSKLEQLSGRIGDLFLEIDDILKELETYSGFVHVDEEELSNLSEKVSHIELLSRKYGGSLNTALKYRDEISAELEKSVSYEEEIQNLERKILQTRQEYMSLAKGIRKKRQQTAGRFEDAICRELNGMDMKDTRFSVSFRELDESEPTSRGLDRCEFFISANVGEKMRPFAMIVSGGETSRFMLAVKMVIKGKDRTATLVFDEVDTGVSGATAEKIGRLLSKLAASKQIICITHLPQIASKGTTHFKVFKVEEDGRTCTLMKKMDERERVTEIATLISGDTVTESGRLQAEKLIQGHNG